MTQTATLAKLTDEVEVRPRSRLAGVFVSAFLLFAALNAFLNAEDRSRGLAPTTVSEKLFDYIGIEQAASYVSRKASVVMLGSSLFAHPEWSVDRKIPLDEAYEKQTVIAQSHYHFAEGFSTELTQKGLKNAFVYNLAADGALISDAYLLLCHYLKNHPKPSFVLLDCAPRSFNDTGVTESSATPVFDCCFQIQDFLELHGAYLKSIDSKVNYLLSKSFFLYHHRKWLSDTAQQWLIRFKPEQIDGGNVEGANAGKKKMAVECSGLQAGNIKEASEESQRFNRSLQEYRDRYQFITTASLDNQLKFLKRIQDLCENKKIELIVVNMPLTRENRKLLAGTFYENFRTVLKKAVGSRNLFLDLGYQNWPQNYYYDSVHLNEIGGSHLNKILADHVVKAAQAMGSGDSNKISAFSEK